ncbi:MAG: glycosyltransferase family 2 protein [Acidiferrobacterales bacterium]|nr:glycosyltransferase family 2 protein [Acidiferrobacterales bacterium]
MLGNRYITAIVPALNEEPSIAKVIRDLLRLQDLEFGGQLIDQVVVCDNGSTDATSKVAMLNGAKVVTEKERGYGAACLAAIKVMSERTDIVVFVDADQSVAVEELPALLQPVTQGADLVIGARTSELCQSGSLTIPQRFGNWLASFLIRKLWQVPVTDLGPFRAITSTALRKLRMEDRRYGWTVEMQVKAIQRGLQIIEVPVSSLRRVGKSKISGTVRGVVGAGYGILTKILQLYLRQFTADVLTRARV